MKIVITRRESFHLPDGINVFIFTLTEELLRRGHDVIGISTCQVVPERVQEMFRCSAYPELVSLSDRDQLGYLATGMTWLRRGHGAVRKFKPDAVIINGAIPIRMPCRSVIVSHDVEQRVPRFRRVRILYKKLCYRLADEIVATCTEVADDLTREIGGGKNGIRIIPTCINLANYDPLPTQERRRAILHMGTVDYKAPEASLQAFAKLQRSDVELFITGRLTQTLKHELEQCSADVRSRVHCGSFLSSSDLKRLVEGVRIVSVPSHYTTPVASPTVLEAFAARTPVVCSKSISGDIIRPGANAIVASNVDDMTDGFERLLNDDEVWERLSQGAAETMLRYSASAVAQCYERLITR